jgi:hypothetical protein
MPSSIRARPSSAALATDMLGIWSRANRFEAPRSRSRALHRGISIAAQRSRRYSSRLEDLQSVLDPELNEEIVKRGEEFPIDGKPAPTPSFKTTFDAMSESERRSILGPGRLTLYNEGKITLKDLVDQQGRQLTLKELKARYGD